MLKFKTREHTDCTSSTDSLCLLCQIKYEKENNIDGKMDKYCKQCVDKKHNTCSAMNVEETDSSDTSNDNKLITNEGNIKITNEQIPFKGLAAPMLLLCDEGKAEIAKKSMMCCKIN